MQSAQNVKSQQFTLEISNRKSKKYVFSSRSSLSTTNMAMIGTWMQNIRTPHSCTACCVSGFSHNRPASHLQPGQSIFFSVLEDAVLCCGQGCIQPTPQTHLVLRRKCSFHTTKTAPPTPKSHRSMYVVIHKFNIWRSAHLYRYCGKNGSLSTENRYSKYPSRHCAVLHASSADKLGSHFQLALSRRCSCPLTLKSNPLSFLYEVTILSGSEHGWHTSTGAPHSMSPCDGAHTSLVVFGK
mmetsp:Transcript_53233/g.86201  ORF Transcript_53233/g.86201 Transcript_53233/m.86201 type:complete len:240 (-) Transcript_53233:148-867(-)